MRLSMPFSYFSDPKLKRIFEIALPIVASRASFTVMLFFDRLFLSRVGKFELAAALSGGLSALVLISFFEGLAGYTNAFVAQYYGAKRYQMCTRAIVHAIYIVFCSYPILLLCIPFIHNVFEFTEQDPTLASFATMYAQILLGGSIFVLLRVAIGSFFIGIGKTNVVMFANITSALISVPLNYVFIFGKLGFSELGIRGAALGTVCAGFLGFIILLLAFLRETSKEPFKVSKPFTYLPDQIRRHFRFGLPTGVEPFLNWFAFNVFVQVMYSYGPDTAASATIAFNWDAVAFVPLLGLGVAATTIVGQHIGAGDYDEAERSVYLTMRLAIAYAILMILLFIVFANPMTRLFSSGIEGNSNEIGRMAATMLRLLALFTIANGTKLVLNGSLRAAGDTRWSMQVAIALHWGMAIITIYLVRVVGVHQYVAWMMLVLMNNTHGASLLYRFRTGAWRSMKLIESKA